MSNEEVQKSASNAAAVIKLVTGVGNNAAWIVMMEGYTAARKCRGYKRSVKGGHTVGWHFKRAVNLFHEYERNLLQAKTNRMFHIDDMEEEFRRKYGNITDEEYYEFWKCVGGEAYSKTKPMITSLWNKYRLSLQSHNINDSENIAWVMTAQAALDLAIAMYESAIKECETGYGLPRSVLDRVFGQFSLRKVSNAWMRALILLAPETEPLKLNSMEEKNIDFGLQQLMQSWMEPDLLYSSASGAVEEFEEIFASKGFAKKVLREIADVKAETMAELEKE